MKTDKLEKLNARSFHYFVASVLRQIAAKEKKDIHFETTLPIDLVGLKTCRFDAFDAIAPNGLNNIEGLVVFEFKYNIRRGNLSTLLSDLYKQIERAPVYTELTIVLITNSVSSFENASTDFREASKQTNFRTEIWGTDVLQNWVSLYPIDFSNAVSRYASQQEADNITSDITDKDFDDKSVNNAKALKHIIESEESFALVLGAGVSVDPGAKSWNELLDYFSKELVRSSIINDSQKLCKKIGDSSLITAQLCKELYKSDNDYYWAIHNGLYDGRKPLNNDFALYHVANIIKRCEHKQHFRVLTYNYDDYLESYLENLKLPFNDLYDSNCIVNNNLSIYHVHGFLPNVKYKTHMLERHQQSIYLTEANYNELYNHPYSWQISSQLSFFRENTCLFIGCSLADPNIRRLLEMTKKENRTHFAILTKDKITIKDLVRASNHFARLGVEVIWVNDFLDIRRQLKELY
jgi:hypothetical protein